eukprot:TRINITY_DN12437_c0_g1_i1.p2 TRINITY_DN12437_c0_g1~~TRINITY_DN12437_c0_g1_i1.p2  ORF type:complete len:50 (+),score=6.57 TRINITY_DN12437_c0_g1_i1:31-180(+)
MIPTYQAFAMPTSMSTSWVRNVADAFGGGDSKGVTLKFHENCLCFSRVM